MKVLLIYPRFPKSFWSFEKTLALSGHKVQIPPLGIITVAAMLPQDWEFKLVDRNIRDVEPEEWIWADMVMVSAMIVQKADFKEQIRLAKAYGKPVVVGGPYPTALPEEARSTGADFLVLGEAEVTLPLFLAALARGETGGTYRSENDEKPDIKQTPIPRYDLLDRSAYAEMAIQFSRGCPFECEFCDIIILYGRKPRTKRSEQFLAELQVLYDLGWRGSVFIVDDNFIASRRSVKELLRELKPWQEAHDFPFTFGTEASIDLAKDEELMTLMGDCRFGTVFLGLETPDTASLVHTGKRQNVREPMSESIAKIAGSGLRVTGGFIIGFDQEKSGADVRIVDFIEQAAIPTAMLSMLQALPGTALEERLAREDRLLKGGGDVNQTTLMNFVPTRPMEEIASEYVSAFWLLYDPLALLNRIYRHYLMLGEARMKRYRPAPRKRTERRRVDWLALKVLLLVAWRQGVVRHSRRTFWSNLYTLWRRYPAIVASYLSVCAQAEHFIDYRKVVRREIEAALAGYMLAAAEREETSAALSRAA